MPTETLDKTAQAILTAQDAIIKFFIEYGFKIFGAAVIIFCGWMLARWLGRFLTSRLDKVEIEPPIKVLMVRAVKFVVIAFTMLIAVQKLGVDIMPLVAGISVMGVGAGLAMQGVLSNGVAGLTIIFTKPYRVGEYVEIHGVEGEVKTIELFSTTLLHFDKSRVVIPNRKVVGEILHNYGVIRQLDLTVGVGYGTDLNQAIALIRRALESNPRVLKEPVAMVGVTTLADSSINISVNPWTKVADFQPAKTELYQAIVDQFRAHQIEIPFPQREIRLLNPPPNLAA
jgi:small conductance mechanosensitive channel